MLISNWRSKLAGVGAACSGVGALFAINMNHAGRPSLLFYALLAVSVGLLEASRRRMTKYEGPRVPPAADATQRQRIYMAMSIASVGTVTIAASALGLVYAAGLLSDNAPSTALMRFVLPVLFFGYACRLLGSYLYQTTVSRIGPSDRL